jgi:cytochrome c
MSDLRGNKITAAILIASLLAMIVGIVANILYKPKLDVAQRGYQIEVSDSAPADASSPTQEVIDIEKLLAQANAAQGEKIAKKCVSCHSFEKGEPHKIGPNLWAVVGENKARATDYVYSKTLLGLGGKWDNESLYHFLNKPGKYAPGTKMSFAGLSKPEDIADVIAYLKTKQ